jgi:hypothetical protein
MARRGRATDTRGTMVAPDPLLEGLASLLSSPAGRDDVAHLERMLTDGYARVLLLEVERVRLEKQLGRLASDAGPRRASRRELDDLAARVEERADDLRRLRTLLAPLHRRFSAAVAERS